MSSIKTYARIKPSLTQFEDVDVVDTDLFLRIPDTVQYYTSLGKGRNKITHQFHFDHVFGEHANQEDVFNTVAVEIVDGNNLLIKLCKHSSHPGLSSNAEHQY